MIKFTKEEISLCKQVREKELLLKPVKEGDWVRNEYGKPSTDLVTSEYIRNVIRFTDIKHWFPLWTISDCLEFLRERKSQMEFELVFGDEWKVIFHWIKVFEGNTPLEACLKAVLAVLEEEK